MEETLTSSTDLTPVLDALTIIAQELDIIRAVCVFGLGCLTVWAVYKLFRIFF